MTTSKVSERGRVWRTLFTPIRLNPFGPRFSSLSHAIEHSALPAPLQTLIHDVTRRTKLWHSERFDVARELIAHFQDGLASGASPETLATNFGDLTQAAALIRRAKKRGRPRAWRAMVTTFKGVAALLALFVAFYLFLAARAFLTSPTISRNYVAELNAPILKIPEANRAWPLYRQAFLAQTRMPKDLLKDFPPSTAASPGWAIGVPYLRESAKTLDLLRQATQRPTLGFPLSDITNDLEFDAYQIWLQGEQAGLDTDKALAMARENADRAPQAASPNPELISVLLPHLGTMRHFARLLVFDAREAAASGDAARAHADLQAMYRMAAHSREHGFLISGLVSLAIHDLASAQLGAILRDRPALLTDDQLISLAHVSSATFAPIDLNKERLNLADILQRTYTDDGHGDGHLTAQGFRLLARYVSIGGRPPHGLDSLEHIQVPAMSGLSPSRRELSQTFDALFERASAYAATPPWQRDDRTSPDVVVGSLSFSPISRIRNGIVLAFMPSFNSSIGANDRGRQTHEAILTAVAVELYRRKHGTFPASLSDIETSILPKIPLDMFDGQPIHYALHDGKPVLYSIGVDRKDDGGRPPEKVNYAVGGPERWVSQATAQSMLSNPTQRPAIDGDWILWPLPPDPIPKPAE